MKYNLILKKYLICSFFIFYVLIIKNNIFAYNIFNSNFPSLVVSGDSYAGYFNDYENNKDFVVKIFAAAGNTVKKNRNLMLEACRYQSNIILFSIGVNDHFQESMPYVFEGVLRDCISEAIKHNKIVFMHSYVEYPSSIALNKKFSIKTYDNIIKRLANETENVYYIDMHDCQGIEYSISDNIHYGRMFYDILYSRMMFILKDLVNS